MSYQPRVSVVIPTIGRPTLQRAVASALNQTEANIEILVCDNGNGPLPPFESDRVRVLKLAPRAGGNAARQAGIESANAPFIALLDDDDYWRPNHLETLLALTATLAGSDWIASSVGELETGAPFPSRDARRNESPLSYCFRARSTRRKGAMPTSGLLFPAALARRVPWRSEVRFHQDLTWIIEVCATTECRLLTNTSVTFDFGNTANSVSKSITLEDSIKWAREVLLPVAGPQLYADFLLTRYPMKSTADRRDVRGVRTVLREAFKAGKPSFPATVYAAAQTARSVLRQAG